MGDPATEKNKQMKKTDVDGTLASSIALQRFIHLGCSFGPYQSRRYQIRGIAPLVPYNFDHVYALGLFSEVLTKDGDRLVIGKDLPPHWESPCPETINVIRKVLKENEGDTRRAALFILAACCRLSGSFQSEAYAFLKEISCGEDLLIFVKFVMDLSPKKKGWGGGLRRALKSWYFEREDMDLAEQLTCIRQRCCWSHKDILKLLHAKPKSIVQEIVINYTMHGIEKAKEHLNDVAKDDPHRQDAEKMVSYLEAADELRKLSIPKGSNSKTPLVDRAVSLIKTHKFQLEHCDDTMHTEPLVWEALLEHMPYWKLLEHLPKLRCNRVLKCGDELNKAIVNYLKNLLDSLTKDPSSISPPISPAVVLVSLQTYRRIHDEDVPSKVWVSTKDGVVAVRNLHGKVLPSNLAAMHKHRKTDKSHTSTEAIIAGVSNLHIDKMKRIKELPKLNQKIVETLNKIFVASVKAMKPTGKRFIFATGKTQVKNGCLVNPHVMTHEAASVLFICLDAVETLGAVKGYCINSNSSSVVELRSPGCSISGFSRDISQESPTSPIYIEAWLAHVTRQKLATDVLVLVAESFVPEKDNGQRLLAAMKKYREVTENPNAKLVIISLDSKILPQIPEKEFDYGILMAYGFDSQLPVIIQRFARGDF